MHSFSPMLRRLTPTLRVHRGGISRSLFIQTQQTPSPSSLKFIISGEEVLPPEYGSVVLFQKGDRSYQRSPLVKRLFAVEYITGVSLGNEFITISKKPDVDWPELKPEIFDIIMNAFAEKLEVITDVPEASDTAIHEDDNEIVAMIKEILETRIRPTVQEDGGDILFVGFDEGTGVVRVELSGACQGCPSSSVTLKHGVENMLTYYIPEVNAVEEVDPDIAEAERQQQAFEKEIHGQQEGFAMEK